MEVALLTRGSGVDDALPALSLLPHSVRVVPPVAASVLDLEGVAVAVVDAREDLAASRTLCRLLAGTTGSPSVMALVTEGGLIAVTPDWGLDDLLLPSTGPAEIDVRLRLAAAHAGPESPEGGLVTVGELVIDEETYAARVRGRPLDLTFKEFELLRHLCHNPGRVFSRAHLLQEVWGYDYFGGARTVDVHVRRLRAKLGPDHEALIGTVRNVGYKAVRPTDPREEGGDA